MDMIEIARSIFALIAVLGMIGLAAFTAKKFGLAQGPALRRGRRLALVETLPLDLRRRAVILACDGREHLLVVDQGRVTVVEQGIPPHESAAPGETAQLAARKSAAPVSLIQFLRRVPRDETIAFRAAGVL